MLEEMPWTERMHLQTVVMILTDCMSDLPTERNRYASFQVASIGKCGCPALVAFTKSGIWRALKNETFSQNGKAI